MAITYLGEVAGGSTANATITVDLTPLSLQQDDLVVAWDSLASNSTARVAGITTSGYTDPGGVGKLTSNDTNDSASAIGYKFMGASPDASVVFGASGASGTPKRPVVRAYRGVDPTTPMDVAAIVDQANINGLLVDLPAITPVTAGALVVVFGAGARASGDTTTYTSSDLSDFTSDVQSAASFVDVVGRGHFAWTSGAFDPAAWAGATDTASDSWTGVILALRPAATGGGVTGTGVASGDGIASGSGAVAVAGGADTAGPGSASAAGGVAVSGSGVGSGVGDAVSTASTGASVSGSATAQGGGVGSQSGLVAVRGSAAASGAGAVPAIAGSAVRGSGASQGSGAGVATGQVGVVDVIRASLVHPGGSSGSDAWGGRLLGQGSFGGRILGGNR
jgi:hypothetical protein